MHGYDWMPSSGGMFGGGIFMLLFWGLVFAAVVALVAWGVRAAGGRDAGRPGDSALQILEERYARGEIGREEYLAKRRDLQR